MNHKKERRLHPRIDKRLPLNVAANGYDFATSTMNVSCVGTYCHIDKYVPPFTKVKIRMELPLVQHGTRDIAPVECHGVIVRSEDEAQGGFNVAIFFNNIREEARHKISQFVSQSLAGQPCLNS